MSNNDEGCNKQDCECQSQAISAEELAQYVYWWGVNGIMQDFLAVGITSLLTLGVFLFLCGHNSAIFWGCTFVFSCIGYGLSFIGRFKVSRLSKIMVCVPSLLMLLWCVTRALLSKGEVVTVVVDIAFATALILQFILVCYISYGYERWYLKRLSRKQYEKNMKKFRSGLSLKLDAFLRRRPSLVLADRKEQYFNAFICLLSLGILFFYIIGGGIEVGDWTIPDEAELRIEKHILPDKDNMYTALVAITNLYHVGEDGGGDENCDVSNYEFVRSYGDFDDAYKTNSLASRERARKILADNADFFPAFHAAVARKGFAVTDSEDCLSEILGMVRLVSMKAQTALEDGNMEAALADIKDIHELGRIMSSMNNGSWQYLVGYGARLFSYEKMRNALAMGVATDKAIMEFMKMIDADDAAASANRERAIKGEYVEGYEENEEELKKEMARRFFADPIIRFVYHPQETKYKVAEIFKSQLDDENRDITFAKGCLTRSDLPWTAWFVPNVVGRYLISLVDHRESISRNFIDDRFDRLRIRLIVASEKWRRAHNGRNPETLDALVPEYISAVPVDPWDEAGGKVKYDAAHGVVWSIGDKGEYDYLKAAAERKKDDFAQVQDDDTRKYAFRLDGRRISFLP